MFIPRQRWDGVLICARDAFPPCAGLLRREYRRLPFAGREGVRVAGLDSIVSSLSERRWTGAVCVSGRNACLLSPEGLLDRRREGTGPWVMCIPSAQSS